MKTIYFDCFSGAAGDMILGALLDADADAAFVREQLEALKLEGWSLEVRSVTRAGLRATYAAVEVDEAQPTRDYETIRAILEAAQLHPQVHELAQAIFGRLAAAEALVHGVELEGVHLHEVAAVDAFIDIVGSAAALVSLAPERVVVSPLPVGGGTTHSDHGPLPVPPPAVIELVEDVPIRGGGERELLTPTGAAILTSIADEYGELPSMRLERTGYGAGTAERDIPNVVRVLIGEVAAAALSEVDPAETALLVEANLDDMAPELLPRAIEQLLAAGAYDAWVVPIIMKKGRPGFTLSALVPEYERDRALDVIYAETTTLGVRVSRVEKDELERSWIEVEVEGHPVRVKIGLRGGDVVTRSPEYEDALRVARASGLPLKDVYGIALTAAADKPAPR